MSGATTELNLATAVDSDDNADYLTLSLANSLRTLDGLFNNVTGHTHGGAHQGGPVSLVAGSVPGSALANGSVTNAKLGSDTARANLLTDGGFEIWQRGNGPFTTSGVYSADRWMLQIGSGSSLSVSRDTSNVDGAGVACAALTYTHSTVSYFQQVLGDALELRSRTVSFSIRVRTGVANGIRAQFFSSGLLASSAYHSGGGAYQTLTVTATLPAAFTAFTVALELSVSGTYYLDNAMLVVGSQYADYAPLHPADDLARCLRYYERVGEGPGSNYVAVGQVLNTGSTTHRVAYKVQKAVTPTITVNAPGGYVVSNAGGTQLLCTAITSTFPTLEATNVQTTVASGLVAGNTTILQNYTTTGYVMIEANP